MFESANLIPCGGAFSKIGVWHLLFKGADKMESALIIAGTIFSIFCLTLIFKEKKKESSMAIDYAVMESEQKKLRESINELIEEFNNTALHTTEQLNQKLQEINKINLDSSSNKEEIEKVIREVELLKKEISELKNRNIEESPAPKKRGSKEKIIKLVHQNEQAELQETVPSAGIIKKESNRNFESEIDEYIKKGLSEKEISEKTGKSIGEIEFIIGLKNMR